jgi:hypothetical protein
MGFAGLARGYFVDMTDDAISPSDSTTLVEVMEAYRSSGFTGDFGVDAEASVRCNACGSVMHAGRLAVHSLRRMEGASDPSDMLALVATTCPVCGSRGLLVLGFGPMASSEDADVLAALQDRRGDDLDLAPRDGPESEINGIAT